MKLIKSQRLFMWQEKYVDVFYCKPLQNVVASSREGEKKKKKKAGLLLNLALSIFNFIKSNFSLQDDLCNHFALLRKQQ